MHGNVCANRDSEESIIDIKNGAEKNFRTIFLHYYRKKVYQNHCASSRSVYLSLRLDSH